ncbi:MAG: nrfA [Thermomicrobiales bacterium]|nr:nrfA [Thermomicrobiales bacterium]
MNEKRRLLVALVLTIAVTIALAALLVNVFQRKQEEKQVFFRVVELTDDTEQSRGRRPRPIPARWSRNPSSRKIHA